MAAPDAGQLGENRLQEADCPGVVLLGKGVDSLSHRQDNFPGKDAALFHVGAQAFKHRVHHGAVTAGGKGQGGVGVAEGRAGTAGGGRGLLLHLFPGHRRGRTAIDLQPPQQGGAIGQGRDGLGGYCRANPVLVDLQGALVAALGQLKQGLVPRQMYVIGGAVVEGFEPSAQKIAPGSRVAPFKIGVGNRVGGHGVGGILFQRTLGQPQRLIQNADFVVGKGVLAQKGPIVAAMGSRLLHQGKQGRRKVGHPGAAAAQHI